MKTEKGKIIYKIGDELDLIMVEPRQGMKRPIAYTEKGMVCLIDREAKGFFHYGTTWTCRVTQVFENKLIVEPLVQIKGKEETIKLVEKKFNQPKQKFEKGVKSYPYKSKQEAISDKNQVANITNNDL